MIYGSTIVVIFSIFIVLYFKVFHSPIVCVKQMQGKQIHLNTRATTQEVTEFKMKVDFQIAKQTNQKAEPLWIICYLLF